MLIDEENMLEALKLAHEAEKKGEIPVGAIVTDKDNNIIGRGFNLSETNNSPTSHAEIIAIEQAAEIVGRYGLSQCTLYVTLEPCPMCAGAIINARIKRVVYGAFDKNGGACSSVLNLFDCNFGHKPQVRSRVLEKDCSEILSRFFKGLRN